jgi:BASS family bile acid:Na+ symporter
MTRGRLLCTGWLVLLVFWQETSAFIPSGSSSRLVPWLADESVNSRRLPAKKHCNNRASQSRLLQVNLPYHEGRAKRAKFPFRELWKSTSKLSASSVSEDESSEGNKLDSILSRLTSAFPFFVLGSAILGLTQPSTLMWTNRGTLISWMLASVMCATGLTLEKKDFTKVLGQDLAAVPAGVLCQFLIMPLTAFLVGRKLLLNSGTHGPSLFLGLCLVGCSPGGTASNLVSLIAKADVALSVLLTSCSTILASIVTPLLVKLFVGSTIEVSGWALSEATARVVLFPVLFGMFVNAKAPNLASRVSRFTPFASVLLVSLICGGVVAQNSVMFFQSSSLIPLIVGSVLSLHCVGFLVGYFIPRWGLGFSEMTSRTISIETGMQNSALAVVLARSIGAPAVASLPGALSATAHSCLGSILAGYWHGRQGDAAVKPSNEVKEESVQKDDTDDIEG